MILIITHLILLYQYKNFINSNDFNLSVNIRSQLNA